MVDELGERRVHDEVAGLAQLQAEVDVVERDRKLLVEPADRLEHLAPRHHAGAGDRGAVAGLRPPSRRSRVGRRAGPAARGAASPPRPKTTPPCWSEPSGYKRRAPTAPTVGRRACPTSGSSQRGLRASMSLFMNKEELARALPDGGVVDRRPVERARCVDEADPGLGDEPLDERLRLGELALVVDEHELDRLVARLGPDRGHARRQERRLVAERDDDADERSGREDVAEIEMPLDRAGLDRRLLAPAARARRRSPVRSRFRASSDVTGWPTAAWRRW